MSVKISDITKKFNSFAPEFLKEDFDNVGLMIGDLNSNVKKVLLALDCTLEVIEEAKSLGCNLIITHHPLIFKKPNRIVKGDLLGDKIINLIKNDIAVYSSHTNLDSVRNGINDEIVKVLGFKKSDIIELGKIEESGIGRVVKLDREVNFDSIINLVKEKLNIETLKVVRGKNTVKSIGIINGSGQSYIKDAVEMGADCIITGDTSYHFASDYKELKISIIDAGHFKTEWNIFLNVANKIIKDFKDIEFIISKYSKDPYEFL